MARIGFNFALYNKKTPLIPETSYTSAGSIVLGYLSSASLADKQVSTERVMSLANSLADIASASEFDIKKGRKGRIANKELNLARRNALRFRERIEAYCNSNKPEKARVVLEELMAYMQGFLSQQALARHPLADNMTYTSALNVSADLAMQAHGTVLLVKDIRKPAAVDNSDLIERIKRIVPFRNYGNDLEFIIENMRSPALDGGIALAIEDWDDIIKYISTTIKLEDPRKKFLKIGQTILYHAVQSAG